MHALNTVAKGREEQLREKVCGYLGAACSSAALRPCAQRQRADRSPPWARPGRLLPRRHALACTHNSARARSDFFVFDPADHGVTVLISSACTHARAACRRCACQLLATRSPRACRSDDAMFTAFLSAPSTYCARPARLHILLDSSKGVPDHCSRLAVCLPWCCAARGSVLCTGSFRSTGWHAQARAALRLSPQSCARS